MPGGIGQTLVIFFGRGFFGQCDGIYLNYGWSKEGLQASHDRAEGRNGEVYVGVDVFGRGCFGGGEYNTHVVREDATLMVKPQLKDLLFIQALEVINECNLSAVLFAPGWVFETQNKSRFFEIQDRLVTTVQARSLFHPHVHMHT